MCDIDPWCDQAVMLTVIFVLYTTLIVIFIAVFSWDTNFLLFRNIIQLLSPQPHIWPQASSPVQCDLTPHNAQQHTT